MDNIKSTLKSYGLSEMQIIKFIEHFEFANEHDIKYPLYYALIKVMA